MAGNRLTYLDYAKGIGIILMLFQHSIPQHNFLRLFMQAFGMPVFFVIGGYIWWYKAKHGKELRFTYGYLKRRLRQLGIPYLIGCLVLTLFFELLNLISGGDHSILHNLFRTVSLQGIESMWFLPVYLCAEVLFLLVIGFNNKHLAFFIASVVLLLFHFLVKFDGAPWPFALIETSLMGFLFFTGGYFCAEHRIHGSSFPAMVLFFLLGLLGARINGFASFAELHVPFLFFADGLMLSLLLITLCYHIRSEQGLVPKAVLFFGRETLFILCSNNLIIEIIRLFDYKVTGNCLLNNGMLGNCLMFLLLCSFEVILILLFRSLIAKCKLTIHPKVNSV